MVTRLRSNLMVINHWVRLNPLQNSVTQDVRSAPATTTLSMTTCSKMRQRGARTETIPTETVFVLSRKPVNVITNDPAKLYTYAATSTLPGSGGGLIARRIIRPESSVDDGEYIGEYMGGENLMTADFQRYMFDPNPDRQTAYMISIRGVIRDGWGH